MIVILIFLFLAIILHEYAHAWVAYKLGDPTAKMSGRLTLNPIKHVDPVGTILVPGILYAVYLLGFSPNFFIIGWAKPVPVNFSRLRDPKRDMIWVGLAGPAVNVALAFALRVIYPLLHNPLAQQICLTAIFLNLLLAVFNMIPIPPLDGSRLVMGLLPNKAAYYYAQLERYGIFIVIIAVMYLDVFEIFVLPGIELVASLMGLSFKGVLY